MSSTGTLPCAAPALAGCERKAAGGHDFSRAAGTAHIRAALAAEVQARPRRSEPLPLGIFGKNIKTKDLVGGGSRKNIKRKHLQRFLKKLDPLDY